MWYYNYFFDPSNIGPRKCPVYVKQPNGRFQIGYTSTGNPIFVDGRYIFITKSAAYIDHLNYLKGKREELDSKIKEVEAKI